MQSLYASDINLQQKHGKTNLRKKKNSDKTLRGEEQLDSSSSEEHLALSKRKF